MTTIHRPTSSPTTTPPANSPANSPANLAASPVECESCDVRQAFFADVVSPSAWAELFAAEQVSVIDTVPGWNTLWDWLTDQLDAYQALQGHLPNNTHVADTHVADAHVGDDDIERYEEYAAATVLQALDRIAAGERLDDDDLEDLGRLLADDQAAARLVDAVNTGLQSDLLQDSIAAVLLRLQSAQPWQPLAPADWQSLVEVVGPRGVDSLGLLVRHAAARRSAAGGPLHGPSEAEVGAEAGADQ